MDDTKHSQGQDPMAPYRALATAMIREAIEGMLRGDQDDRQWLMSPASDYWPPHPWFDLARVGPFKASDLAHIKLNSFRIAINKQLRPNREAE